MKDLTDMQKRRLAAAMAEAVSKRQTLYLARIGGASEYRVEVLRKEMTEADDRFEQLFNARGFCAGDLVAVSMDMPWETEATVTDISPDGMEITVRLPEGGPITLPSSEMTMADQRNDRQRRKHRR